MKICSNCNRQSSQDTIYCDQCGQKFDEEVYHRKDIRCYETIKVKTLFWKRRLLYGLLTFLILFALGIYFMFSPDRPIYTLKGHNSIVTEVMFTPDGREIITASLDKKIKVWDTGTGSNLETYIGGNSYVYYLALDQQKRYFVSSSDKTIVWDFVKGQALTSLNQRGPIAITPDGKYVIIMDILSAELTVHNSLTGSIVRTLQGQGGGTCAIKISSNGKYLVTTDGKQIWIWDVAQWKKIRVINTMEAGQQFDISLDSRFLAYKMAPNLIKVVEIESGKEVNNLEIKDNHFTGLAFSPDGNHLASAVVSHEYGYFSSKDKITIWDLSAGKQIQNIFPGISIRNTIKYSPHGECLAVALDNSTVKVFATH